MEADTSSCDQSQERSWHQHQSMQQEEDSTLVNDSDSSCYIANSADNDPRTPVSKTNDDLAIDLQQPSSEAHSGSYILPDFEGCNDYSNFLSLCNNEKSVLDDQRPNDENQFSIPIGADNHNNYLMTGLHLGPLELQDWLPPLQSPIDFDNLNSTTEDHPTRTVENHSKPLEHLATGCHCIDNILAANEKIQLQLVSEGHCFNTNIDNTLQCQKTVLTCIEGLLGCSRCSSRSDYITLTISVCRGVMRSVINVIDTTIHPVLAEAVPGSSLLGIRHPEGAKDTHINRSRSGSNNSNMTGLSIGSDSTKMRTTAAGGWRLDDYEEMQIALSLFNLRVKKLQKLIQQLEQVAIDNGLGCIRVVQAMRLSFENRIAAMEPSKSRQSWEVPTEGPGSI